MKTSLKLATLVLAAALPFAAQAHKAWLHPSATVLSSNDWITVDAAVSNDLFHFNHVPLRAESLRITAPDGSTVPAQNLQTGQLRTVFDLQLVQDGTWRIASVNQGLFASWEENGQPKRWRGHAEAFAREVPANAEKLQVVQSAGRNETYVTAGAPTTAVFAPTGVGLELQPVTHPNDLYAGEEARFRLLIDGAPAADLEVTAIRGAQRYRDGQDEIVVRTGADGEFRITWPAPGMYWLEATLQDDKASLPQASQRRASYVVTLEVLPQ
ncbi:DUF4198 domain-containing protein [Arenimonas composti]|uniref:ABC transporter permease n=1 Tax=Arenimonas composti TR7-09 = DSM 18010 TaxID=1121013 RepID=A0A091BA65_9GAMM|nr:DUF4198 domain-containing protein [Arenimonas composti]KFN49538.1 hypothetical protein P873_10315 [Arenimonas composti TR7-09 = DSM 18010]